MVVYITAYNDMINFHHRFVSFPVGWSNSDHPWTVNPHSLLYYPTGYIPLKIYTLFEPEPISGHRLHTKL